MVEENIPIQTGLADHQTITLTGPQDEQITVKVFPDNSAFISFIGDTLEDGRVLGSFGPEAIMELYEFIIRTVNPLSEGRG